MKTLKALAVFVLFLSVVYVGLLYFYNDTPETSDIDIKNKKLSWLKDKLEEIDCDIRDQLKSGIDISDAEEARRELLRDINTLKKDIAYNFEADNKSSNNSDLKQIEHSEDVPTGQKTLPKPIKAFFETMGPIGIIGFVVILIIGFVLIFKKSRPSNTLKGTTKVNKSSKPDLLDMPISLKPVKPLSEFSTSKSDSPSALSEAQLKDTINKFKAIMPEIKEKETTELELGNLRERIKETSGNEMKTLKEASILDNNLSNPEPSSIDSSHTREVIRLMEEGHSVEEIAEKLRLDQDQVRLIIKFND